MLVITVRVTAALIAIITAGCAESNILICDTPTFSKLAGRWSTTLRDAAKAFGGEGSPCPDLPGEFDDRILLITINPDGTFDWTKSLYGMLFGLHDLAKPGDQSVGRRFQSGRFEVASAKYSPTSSTVEIRGLSQNENIAQSLRRATVSIELQPDGSARAIIRTETVRSFTGGSDPPTIIPDDPEREEYQFQLRRHDRCRREIANRSSIEGGWSIHLIDDKLALIIRPDGSFDWTGTMEGILMGMYQLEFPNDKSFCSMDPRLQFELRSADYRPDKSEIRLRSFNRTCSSQIECHLTARRQDERSIKVDLVARHAGALTKRVTRVLHKNEKASERHELCFDKLLDNGGEQEKEIGIGP